MSGGVHFLILEDFLSCRNTDTKDPFEGLREDRRGMKAFGYRVHAQNRLFFRALRNIFLPITGISRKMSLTRNGIHKRGYPSLYFLSNITRMHMSISILRNTRNLRFESVSNAMLVCMSVWSSTPRF